MTLSDRTAWLAGWQNAAQHNTCETEANAGKAGTKKPGKVPGSQDIPDLSRTSIWCRRRDLKSNHIYLFLIYKLQFNRDL
jgi:hypothetical protein